MHTAGQLEALASASSVTDLKLVWTVHDCGMLLRVSLKQDYCTQIAKHPGWSLATKPICGNSAGVLTILARVSVIG